MTIMRRKAVLAVNANNRYTVLLYGVKGADWSHLPELLQDEIKAAWVRDKMPKSKIKKYFSLAGPVEVTKTHGSKAVAAMNGCMYIMNTHPIYLDSIEEGVEDWMVKIITDCFMLDIDNRSQPYAENYLNKHYCHCAGYSDFTMPKVFLRRDLEQL